MSARRRKPTAYSRGRHKVAEARGAFQGREGEWRAKVPNHVLRLGHLVHLAAMAPSISAGFEQNRRALFFISSRWRRTSSPAHRALRAANLVFSVDGKTPIRTPPTGVLIIEMIKVDDFLCPAASDNIADDPEKRVILLRDQGDHLRGPASAQ
jgi:hypothetical protein